MRDYDELVKALRMCDGDVGACRKCPRYGTDDCHGVFGEAADAIEELVAAVPKWISVEERLPDKREWVLVRSKLVKMRTDFISRDGNWYTTPCATHWMPLPSAPKESP